MGEWFQEKMSEAANKVLGRKLTLRRAVETYGIPYTSSQWRVFISKCVIKTRGEQRTIEQKVEKILADRHLANRSLGFTLKAVFYM